MRELNKEVFVADGPIVVVGRQDIESLQAGVNETERKRVRLCAHQDIGDKLQEMFIVLSKETYIRPHKHINKAESLQVIYGEADAVFFNDSGEIIEVIHLGDYSSGKQFYYRIDEPIYHTLLIYSEVLIFNEATQGPFKRSDTVFAPWSPDEGDISARDKLMEKLLQDVKKYCGTKQ